jgi:hypothetical protein
LETVECEGGAAKGVEDRGGKA